MRKPLYFEQRFALDRRAMRGRQWSWVDGLFFALTAAYFYSLVPYGLNLDDEGTLLYQIYRTSLGHRLYTDFHAGYTPGVYWWNGLLFRLLAVNVLVIRFALAVVNSLAVYLIYLLAQKIGAKRWPAALAAWAYVALIPYYDGQFFSANIPYPIWYVTLLWLLGVAMVLRWWERGSAWWLFAAGAAAGLVFGFKPNSGILAAAGSLSAVAVLLRVGSDGDPARGGWFEWSTRALLVVLPFLAVTGLAVVVTGAGGNRELAALVLPVLAFAAVTTGLPAPLRRTVSWRSAWWNGLSFGAGMALMVLPWAWHYWRQLGTAQFLRTTLFVGTGFDKFYFLPYPPFSSFSWGVFAFLFFVLVAYWAMRQRFLHGRVLSTVGVAVVVLVGAALLRHPPAMVEGLTASVTMRVRDVSFALALASIWLAVGAAVIAAWRLRVRLRSGKDASDLPERTSRQLPLFVIVLFAALFMHAQLYPRTDFMHLVPAVPALLVVGAALTSEFAGRFGAVLCRSLARGRRFRTLALLPVAVGIIALTAPAWQRIWYLWQFGWRSGDAVVRLQSGRAPLVIEPAAGRLFFSINETTRFLIAHTAPGEFVFTFPVLDVLSFLADRHNPTRHGYFFPGWPGHEVEAEVIDALRQRPPRFVVTLHDHPLFFATAPVYYFNLRDYVTRNYRLVAQVGVFNILAPGTPKELDVQEQGLPGDPELWQRELRYRRGATAAQLRLALAAAEREDPEAIAAVLADARPAVQYEAVRLIRKSRSSLGAAALAHLLEGQRLEGKEAELAIRTIAEIGDARSVAPLLRLYDTDPASRPAVAGLLFHISSKLAFASYWFSQDWRAADRALASIEWERLADWADNPFEPLAVRVFAVRVAPHLQAKTLAPIFIRLLGDRNEWVDLSSQAADAVAALDLARPVFPAIVRLLRFDRLWVPAVVVKEWDRDDSEGRAALEFEMTSPQSEVRAVAFWVAAGVRDAALQPLLERGLDDPEVEVRMAAAWGLGELGERSAVAALELHVADPDDRVRAFVRSALAKLGALVPG
ncbi:MAG: HEAT repeat domain-containing protein [Candidatus Binatia bacterium]|nr:HEAT repeat domain-containing protein [Candidatus Binatia bacterium]